jgi:hypothetical protein
MYNAWLGETKMRRFSSIAASFLMQGVAAKDIHVRSVTSNAQNHTKGIFVLFAMVGNSRNDY